MPEQFTNRAQTTLNGAINNSVTSLTVTSASGFPTSGNFRIVVDPRTATEEIMTVTDVSGTTFTVIRASESIAGVQTAFSHSDGAIVAHVLTVGSTTTTMPTIVGVGASASGTGDVTPALYTGHRKDDIIFMAVQSSAQTPATPTDYKKTGPYVGFGGAASAGATRLTCFWKRHDGSESDPTITDTGDHTLAVIIGIRGCVTTGNPFLNMGARRNLTASTTATSTSGTTQFDKALIMDIFTHALDSASTAFSAPTNASLSDVTLHADVATADGTGGGIGIITGGKALRGDFVATTATVTSAQTGALSFAFIPENVSHAGLMDRQVFLTATMVDTWIKPDQGGKISRMRGFGGGASGSAGRNAATAAGGGGGGAGMWHENYVPTDQLPATLSVTVGGGGAATANTDGAASQAGGASQVSDGTYIILSANGGGAATASASGAGGTGGNGGGRSTAAAAGTGSWTVQPAGGGTGGTTAMAGAGNLSEGGGSGAGGGTTQANSSGGSAMKAGGGGGGGRSNTNFGPGGGSVLFGQLAGGATASANGQDSPYPYEFGGSGGAGGTSTSGPGGSGGFPAGGGGGGGSQSGAQRGGAGGSGLVVIDTIS